MHNDTLRLPIVDSPGRMLYKLAVGRLLLINITSFCAKPIS